MRTAMGGGEAPGSTCNFKQGGQGKSHEEADIEQTPKELRE